MAPGSACTAPWTKSAASSAATPAASQPGVGTQSASVKASARPEATAAPALRAGPGPNPPSRTTRTAIGAAAATAAVASVEPSSTTITSNSKPASWAASPASVAPRVAAALRAGTMTLAATTAQTS